MYKLHAFAMVLVLTLVIVAAQDDIESEEGSLEELEMPPEKPVPEPVDDSGDLANFRLRTKRQVADYSSEEDFQDAEADWLN